MVSGLSVPSAPERLDLERRAFLDLLRMANTLAAPEEIARQLVVLTHHLSGCEAVAIRLKAGPGYPYAASLGFSKAFLAMENELCASDESGHLLRDGQRQPILDCFCGQVLSGLLERGLPWATDQGSFSTPSTSQLAAASPCARARNHCCQAGYETVGLFPIRRDGVTYGLIQCNDRRPGRLSPEAIDLLEDFAGAAAHLFQLTMA